MVYEPFSNLIEIRLGGTILVIGLFFSLFSVVVVFMAVFMLRVFHTESMMMMAMVVVIIIIVTVTIVVTIIIVVAIIITMVMSVIVIVTIIPGPITYTA
jgi:hypothetical protein